MRNWKKPVAFWLSIIMIVSLAGCGTNDSANDSTTKESETITDIPAENDANEEDAEEKNEEKTDKESLAGAHVFIFKSSENPIGDLMYEGFDEYMTAKGQRTVYMAPKDATPNAQIQLLEEIIAQDVASITVSASGNEGYEEILEAAQEANIPIVSVDSELNPEYRVCHVEQALVQETGSFLVQAAVLGLLQTEYPGDGNMEETVAEKLDEYEGDKIVLGVLSSAEDSPAQNEWIAAMKKELKKDMYSGKVSKELIIKYGNDDAVESKVQVGAFLREDEIDCIIAPTTVGLAAAAEVLRDNDSDIMLTGLGLPSEMQEYMPLTDSDNTFDSVCPYMILWDVPHLGAVAAAATYAAANGEFTGEAGEKFEMDAFRDYEATEYEAYTSGDGTGILAGVPIVFHKGNMANWIEVL